MPPYANLPLIYGVRPKFLCAKFINKDLVQLVHKPIVFSIRNACPRVMRDRPFALVRPVRKVEVQNGGTFPTKLNRHDATREALDPLCDRSALEWPILGNDEHELRSLCSTQRRREKVGGLEAAPSKDLWPKPNSNELFREVHINFKRKLRDAKAFSCGPLKRSHLKVIADGFRWFRGLLRLSAKGNGRKAESGKRQRKVLHAWPRAA
jgi:hypothetical protein